MDPSEMSEEEKQSILDKASNWGYTKLRPSTEDETKLLNEHLKKFNETEKNYKPSKPVVFPKPVVFTKNNIQL